MNKQKIFLTTTVLGMMLFASQVGAEVANAPGVPGSVDDPVVTKSYVDAQIQRALSEAGGNKLIVVQLEPGQALYGFEGTEFIVRTGKVVAVAGVNGDGLTDITAGIDLKGGAPVPYNHLLLIARSDSRGLRPASSFNGTAYIMVRGKYELK